jgi:selenoprotein W-related protein
LAKAIEKKCGIKTQLIPSSGGVFEVIMDGNKIFSKKDTGRFPTNQEILEIIGNKQRSQD